MRSWVGILAAALWAAAMGCTPQVTVQASSDSTSGEGGSSSGGTGEGGSTSSAVDGGGTGGSGGTPLSGAKYVTKAGYFDVAWDSARNHVFLSGGVDGVVRVLDLQSSAWTSLMLGHRPEHLRFDAKLDLVLVSMAVQDHQPLLEEAEQSGYFGRIDAATLLSAEPIPLPLDPWEIASDGAKFAYIDGGSGAKTHLMIVNPKTGSVVVVGSGFLGATQSRMSLQLHPDKNRLYALTSTFTVDQFERYNVPGPTMPYTVFGDTVHNPCGELRIHPAGTTMYSACGNVFLTTMNQDTDMSWTGDLGFGWRDLAFRPGTNLAYVIPDLGQPIPEKFYKPLLYALDTDSLKVVATYKLGAPAERVLTSESGIVLVRGTHGDKPTTEVEVIPYDVL